MGHRARFGAVLLGASALVSRGAVAAPSVGPEIALETPTNGSYTQGPAVAYADGVYVVAWVEQRPSIPMSVVRAARVRASDRVVLDDPPITVGISLSNPAPYDGAAAAFDGTYVLVASRNMAARLRPSDGAVVDVPPVTFDVTVGVASPKQVATNGVQYLLVSGQADSLRAIRVRASDLVPLDAPPGILLQSGGVNANMPAVAAVGSDFFVTWVLGPPWQSVSGSTVHSSDGSTTTPSVVFGSGFGASAYFDPAVAPGIVIAGADISGSTTIVRSPHTPSCRDYSLPPAGPVMLAPSLDIAGSVAVWLERVYLATSYTLHASRLDPTTGFLDCGTTGAITIDSVGDDRSPVVASGGGTTLVVYDRAVGGGSPQLVGRFLGDGSLASPCTTDMSCGSGHCVDGVCCADACGGGAVTDCMACSVAAGAAADGACGPVASGRACRGAVDACDLTERCDGVATSCPADAHASEGSACAGGTCSNGACESAPDAGADAGSDAAVADADVVDAAVADAAADASLGADAEPLLDATAEEGDAERDASSHSRGCSTVSGGKPPGSVTLLVLAAAGVVRRRRRARRQGCTHGPC